MKKIRCNIIGLEWLFTNNKWIFPDIRSISTL